MGAGEILTEDREREKGMKIGFITPSLSECGGLQRVQSLLANELAQKHDVTIIALEDGRRPLFYELDSRIHVVYEDIFLQKNSRFPWGIARAAARKGRLVLPAGIARRAYYPEKIVRELRKKWAEEGYECLVGSTAFCSVLLGLMAGELNGVKLIGWHHSSFSIYFQTPGKGFYIQQKLAERALKRLDALVTLTRHDKEEYKRWMCIEGKYIYNPLSFTSEAKSEVSGKTLLFVSRLETHLKGLDFLSDIAALLFHIRGHADWRLEIVGDGNGMEDLRQMIHERGLEDQVVLLGEKKEVKEYYLNASVFLCTSRWEGFGLSVTEAMECGVPAVSFRTDGPSEIIQDGKSGYLADNFDVEQFADKVEILMEDDELRRTMSKEAAKRAECFSLKHIGAEWEKLLQDPEGYQT